MPIESWDDERVATLTRMWAEGHSATRIGVALDMSRCAVMGKIARLSLPVPAEKLPVIIDYSYRRQCSVENREARREKARLNEMAYRDRRRNSLKTKQDVRAQFLARGSTTTSPEYRKHLPPAPEMTKVQLRAMLAQAIQNTAAL